MVIISWNVNGLRAVLKKGFEDFVRAREPDVLCLQETKVTRGAEPQILPDYRAIWHCAERAGYAGTAVFTRVEPRRVAFGLGASKVNDDEGRVITLEFDDYFLVNCYTPNAQRGLTRLEYRTKVWDPAFLRSRGAVGGVAAFRFRGAPQTEGPALCTQGFCLRLWNEASRS